MARSPLCFVAMPFRPDLNFFYLYLQHYLKERHGLQVERGDHRILTKPLLEKVRDQILAADVVLGDITGRNANVFYELGLADAYGKAVILITQDEIGEAPSDVRHFEFIRYDLGRHEDFLQKIDNAIHNVFVERYRAMYERALELLKMLNDEMQVSFATADPQEFQARVMRGERTEGLPDARDHRSMAEFLLPRILQDTSDLKVMRQLTAWLARTYGS